MLLLILAALSGLGGLSFEILYLRHLSMILGDMFYVHAALLAIFMLGLGIGAKFAHHFIRTLFVFEIAAGTYALLFPSLAHLYQHSNIANSFSNPATQAIVATCILLAFPAICIGISIPLFSAWLQQLQKDNDAFAKIYFYYNLGACIAVLLIEFYAIRHWGISRSLNLIGLALITCGLILAARYTPKFTIKQINKLKAIPLRAEILALAITGFSSALFQGLYFKLSYHLLLPQRENFAILTAVTLLAFAMSPRVTRYFRLSLSDCAFFALLAIALIFASFKQITETYRYIIATAHPAYPMLISIKFLFASILGFFPLLFFGATIPALMRPVKDENSTTIAYRSGYCLFIIGIANAAGFLTYVFIIHPYSRLFSLVALLACLLLGAAQIASKNNYLTRRMLTLGIVLLLSCKAWLISDDFVYAMNINYELGASMRHYKSASDNATYIKGTEKDFVTYNGHRSITVSNFGRPNRAEIIVGAVPAFSAPSLQNALIIGLGTGITAGTTAKIFSNTDIVEINHAFIDMLPDLSAVNFDLANNTKASIHHDDGRRYLINTTKSYDAIINTLPGPTFASASKLYTTEFLNLVKIKLTPGGVYATWFSPMDMSAPGLQILLSSLSKSFNSCGLWVLRQGYYLSVCSDEPIRIRAPISITLPKEVRSVLLKSITFSGLEDYFAAIHLSDNIFKNYSLNNIPVNTDDLPLLEFAALRRGSAIKQQNIILAQANKFNIRLPNAAKQRQFIQHAIVMSKVHRRYFWLFYWPHINKDLSLRQDFIGRVSRLAAFKDSLLIHPNGRFSLTLADD